MRAGGRRPSAHGERSSGLRLLEVNVPLLSVDILELRFLLPLRNIVGRRAVARNLGKSLFPSIENGMGIQEEWQTRDL